MLLRRTRRRIGFTLIELLVVIAIIGVLAALILPGVQSARSAARRTQCINNMKNIGIAFQTHAGQKGYLPASGYWDVADPTKYAEWDALGTAQTTSGTGAYMRYSWCVTLLPFLEHSDIYDQWDFGQAPASAAVTGGGFGSYWQTTTTKLTKPNTGNQQLANTPVSIFTCPSDPTLVPGKGNLSFVVNGGFRYHWRYDHNADGTKGSGLVNISGTSNIANKRATDNMRNMGLMFMQTTPQYASYYASQNPTSTSTYSDQRNATLEGVRDGTTTTIMMSENINAGWGAVWQTDGQIESNWACPHPWNTSFYVNGLPNGASNPTVNVTLTNTTGYDYTKSNKRGSSAGPNVGTGNGDQGGINGDLSGANEGIFPFPNSTHTGGVNALMCDGGARFFSDNIDATVWSKYVTPNGSRLVNPSDGTINGAAQEDPGTHIGFTQAPLREDS